MKILQRRWIAAWTVVLAGCAGQFPPSGGPVDTEPPYVASVQPPPFTTFFTGDQITVEFNEYVERSSVEGAVFLSPDLGILKFDWSGRTVTIRFGKPLRENTTYVMTLGTDVVDLNNRNRMAQSYAAAFSTGGEIDRGQIEGMIHPVKDSDQRSGVMVFAYRLPPGAEDTLNPRNTPPDYITQTGKEGEFVLRHLALGAYRVFAVRDEYRNLLYDPETDEFGVQGFPIELTPSDTARRQVLLQLAREDTTAPRLVGAAPLTIRSLRLSFSEPIDTASMGQMLPIVADTATGASVRVQAAALQLPKATEATVICDPLVPGAVYAVGVPPWRDAAGNRMNPDASSFVFTAADSADTARVDVASISVADSTTGHGQEKEIFIHFTRPLQRIDPGSAVMLRDSSGAVVETFLRWPTDAAIAAKPVQRLRPSLWYVLSVDVSNVADVGGEAGRDTSYTVRFRTVERDVLSSLEGVVEDDVSEDATGPVVVLARRISAGEEPPSGTVLEQPGRFWLEELAEGRYVVSAFRDRNGNSRYDPGSVIPFEFAERFTVHRDTLSLRARWPLEGLKLRLR